MANNQGTERAMQALEGSSTETKVLDPKTRYEMNFTLCKQSAIQLLTDAGNFSKIKRRELRRINEAVRAKEEEKDKKNEKEEVKGGEKGEGFKSEKKGTEPADQNPEATSSAQASNSTPSTPN